MGVTKKSMWVLIGVLVLLGSSCEKKLPVVDYSVHPYQTYYEPAVFSSEEGDTLIAYYFNGAGDPFKGGIYLYDLGQGKEELLFGEVSAEGIDFSPDGQWLVLSVNEIIWKTTLEIDTPIFLAADEERAGCFYPDWSSDGQKIAYDIAGGPNGGIWTMDPDGGNQQRLVERARNPAWSPDGNELYYQRFTDSVWTEIYSYDLTVGEEKRLTFLRKSFAMDPAVSPSGSLIVFVVHEDKRLPELWIMGRNGENPHPIADDGANPVFYSEQQILYTKVTWGDGRLWLIGIDGSNDQLFLE
jgi:Tol biopolymer transport system component